LTSLCDVNSQRVETLAYAEGFLTAFFYSPIEKPQAGDRAWIAHLKGFTKEFQTARLNSGPLPKRLTGVQESAIAMKQSATAVEADVSVHRRLPQSAPRDQLPDRAPSSLPPRRRRPRCRSC
jgi:hypothetical protein